MLALATNDENTMNLRTLLLSTLLASNIAIADETPLTLDVYNADSNSFHVNATLVYGRTDAILIDTGFTKADAQTQAEQNAWAKQLNEMKAFNPDVVISWHMKAGT